MLQSFSSSPKGACRSQTATGHTISCFLQNSSKSRVGGVLTLLEDAPNRELLAAWKDGNQLAAQVLVRRYMARMTALARSRLSDRLARRIDADDIVMSAWRSFFVAVNQSRINSPADDNLWPLLVTITLRKLSPQAAHHSAERRNLRSESSESVDHWQNIVAQDPTPDDAAVLADELESLMSRLSTSEREVLTLRLQGKQQVEIAETLDCSERTVRRSLQRIRNRFLQHNRDAGAGASIPGERIREPNDYPPRPSSTATGFQQPTVSFNQVLLQQLIGQGTFGKVYRALHRTTDSAIAVKFLKRRLWKDQLAVHRMVQAFELLNAMDHPGTIRFHGWGRTPHGSTFLTMEWINGDNPRQWKQLNDLTPNDMVECGLAVCEAVATAHQSGIIHGDLTPDNVLRESTGRYVLTDFGLSQCTGQPTSASVGGTPGYLAPEQLSRSFGSISTRTDVFGLGGILYFLLTGQPPVTGKDIPEITARSLSSTPIPALPELTEDITPDLRQIVSQCLQKEPADRPGTVVDVQLALTQVMDSLQ